MIEILRLWAQNDEEEADPRSILKMDKTYILSKEELLSWIDKLTSSFIVAGPVAKKRGQTVFEKIGSSSDICLDYCSAMTAPRSFIYPPVRTLFNIDRDKKEFSVPEGNERGALMIFGIHPCDMHAITVLDRTFLGYFKDAYYGKARESSFTVVINCLKACDKGFCLSMGTGPFLRLKEGYDIQITPLEGEFLMEFGSERGTGLAASEDFKTPEPRHFKNRTGIEKAAAATFTKSIDTNGLPELLGRNTDHPVYKETAESRCLGCTNCTMVCPTCYCYDIEDRTSFDLDTTRRSRRWDSCQELNFAKVHGGNFRSSREARLRQFVTHKLGTWVEQYGCFGCVGCGRCMTWCPTEIDLTEMAKEIQEDFKHGKAR
jgi:sulfhydrogenase subunit beta (sulfur reductase)